MDKLTGSLSPMISISGTLSSESTLAGTLMITAKSITIPAYTGEYTVKPNFDDQLLETKGKRMTDDVTINAIEVSRVSNLSGGLFGYGARNIQEKLTKSFFSSFGGIFPI